MHKLFRTTTPPPFLWLYAVVGHTSAQGAGSQARQRIALNPDDKPPEDSMRIPAQVQDSFLWISLAQAREHEWHPVHWSIRGVVSSFISLGYR
jgi:hypothetical protein